MYYPYFRGKQNELILLRDQSQLISNSKIIPIIEPVKSNFKPLERCLQALNDSHAEFILIVNPRCGEISETPSLITEQFLTEETLNRNNITLGFIVNENANLDELSEFSNKYQKSKIALIHYGYLNSVKLSEASQKLENITTHIFIEPHAQKRYRSRFNNGTQKVLIRDGFTRRPNREHPPSELFSELHIMFSEENCTGFGDFLIAGEEFSESGGPAYAVAIHLTYLEAEAENDMYIKHYVSDRNSTPTDPGGKFLEALFKLNNDIKSDQRIFHSSATEEFSKLYKHSHFPGLGVVKKLSMQHHIELIADYLATGE